MCKVIITDAIRERAARNMWVNYQKNLLAGVLDCANESDIENETACFLTDTCGGRNLLIAGTDSRVNENGELVTKDKDGNEVIVEGARVFETVSWTTANGVEKTTVYYTAEIADLNTAVRAERVLSYWLNYRIRKNADIYEGIEQKRESAEKGAKELENAANGLLRYIGKLPAEFVDDYKKTYEKAVKFGHVFDVEITTAFDCK